MEKVKIWVYMAAMTLLVLGVAAGTASAAQSPVNLGTAGNFTILSAAPNATGAVTCTNSTVNGDVGSSGSNASVVQTLCTINGTVIAPVSAQVLIDFNSSYDQYANISCTGSLNTTYTGETLTLTPGVYCNDAAVTFTNTTLTLDGQGNTSAVWIFKIGTNGTGALTGTRFSVVMSNSGLPCNVYWWVAEAATMTTSGFQGTILAGAAITITGLAGNSTPFNGDALAKAAVTMTDVIVTGCKATGGGTVPPTPKPCRDFVTGGGWINGSSDVKDHKGDKKDKENSDAKDHNSDENSKATFGVSGGIMNGKFWGQLSFNDHNGTKVKSTNVTAYTVIDNVTRQIKGIARVNGKGSFNYTVVVADNGEPGRNKDSFSLYLSNGYNASGILQGGNIQLHKECGKPHDKGDKENYYDTDEIEGHNNCDK